MCSKPKVPAPTAIIERQPYKSPNSREALAGGGDNEARRRLIAGIATSARGLTEPASTTKRVRAGGDTPILPLLGGGSSSTTGAAPAPAPSPAPAATPVSAPTPVRVKSRGVALGAGGMARNIAAVLSRRA